MTLPCARTWRSAPRELSSATGQSSEDEDWSNISRFEVRRGSNILRYHSTSQRMLRLAEEATGHRCLGGADLRLLPQSAFPA